MPKTQKGPTPLQQPDPPKVGPAAPPTNSKPEKSPASPKGPCLFKYDEPPIGPPGPPSSSPPNSPKKK